MPSRIALLGATGQTGRGVLQNLLEQDVDINIYVRSKSRLVDMFPSISCNTKVTIFEGDISDQSLLAKLLTGVDTIIFTLGWNENRPGTHIIEEGARAIITALQELSMHNEQKQAPPRLIFLSSVSWNERLNPIDNPPLMTRIIRQAFYYPYQDLLAGQKILCSNPNLVNVTLIQPGALIEEAASGYDISIDKAGVGISYPDLSAAMVEVAMEGRFADVPAVVVTSKAGYEFGRTTMSILTGRNLDNLLRVEAVPLDELLDLDLVVLGMDTESLT
ncbi:hypothetical protein D6D01_03446, partial [Aureobasidium pullulans]